MTKGQETRRANLAKKLSVQILDEREMRQFKRLTDEKALESETYKTESVRVFEEKQRLEKAVATCKPTLEIIPEVRVEVKDKSGNVAFAKTRYTFEP
jgi:hypothetical protein